MFEDTIGIWYLSGRIGTYSDSIEATTLNKQDWIAVSGCSAKQWS